MAPALKVLHVSESEAWSGGAAQLTALAKGLQERGWEVAIACRSGGRMAEASRERGLRVIGVPLREDYDLPSAVTLARLIQKENIDVVHAHHSRSHALCVLAKLLLKFRGAPVPILVVSRRVSFPRGKNPFSLLKYRSPMIDCYLAVADAVKGVLVEGGVRPEKVRVVYSGVDTRRYSPRPPERKILEEFKIPAGVPVIGKIANYAPWKGQDVFLEAARLLSEKGSPARFLLAGRDTDGPEVRAKVRSLGIDDKTILAGFREDVPEILSCLKVSVNAATKGEGLSGALRESLSMGIAVVASDVAGNRELLGDSAGPYLFPPGDAQAMAERLDWILKHEAEAAATGKIWRSRVESEFSLKRTIEITEAIYRELLAQRPGKSAKS